MNDGGPAFPPGYNPDEKGMSLRDYFAAAALTASKPTEQIMVSAPIIPEWASALARDCYTLADAMLKAREDKP